MIDENEYFRKIINVIRRSENYQERDCKTIGGMWIVDTYIKNDITYQLMDEGYTDRIFVKDKLDVYQTYNRGLKYEIGNKYILKEVYLKLLRR